ncbi:hypothetical protein GpartN1_g3363.t1 [Galdieria partita]|uniref:Uncharacterized protein n=1 Tax=Galdieria partita TaxID=83374 RepID=A0A9C7UQI8_9RHOD|nr:hypothetical protein GpartN1_g3363.t1 [Galdieria partita]
MLFAFVPLEIATQHKSFVAQQRRKNVYSKNSKYLWKALEQSCLGCGRESGVLRGCDGKGRIVGGLGAIWKWWPIKVYRPCPEMSKQGGTYQRAGQTLEELFGRNDMQSPTTPKEQTK